MTKLVDQIPITRPRSCRWNQPAMVPTLPDQPVAWDRPLTNMRPIITGIDSVTPIATVTAMESAIPSKTFRRGPSLVPMPEAMNCPMA